MSESLANRFEYVRSRDLYDDAYWLDHSFLCFIDSFTGIGLRSDLLGSTVH